MPNNSCYYGLRKETIAGTAVRPWPRPGVVQERPRRPRWQGIARLFQRACTEIHPSFRHKDGIRGLKESQGVFAVRRYDGS
jgi:hypothetical protein